MINKAINMYDELGACAIEQGYSIEIDNKICIDIQMILLFKDIIKKELNISDKTFEVIRIYGKR